MLNLTEVQDQILDHLESKMTIPVVEQAIPDAHTVKKVGGQIQPYMALQFGDLQRRSGGTTFTSVRDYDYELPIYVQVCAADPRTARRIASGQVLDTLLGLQFDWTGAMRKRPGGGMYPLTNSTGATEAYLFPSSWGIVVQLNES